MTAFKVGDKVRRLPGSGSENGWLDVWEGAIYTVSSVGESLDTVWLGLAEASESDNFDLAPFQAKYFELVEAVDEKEMGPEEPIGYKPSRFEVWSRIPDASIERLDEVWEWVSW